MLRSVTVIYLVASSSIVRSNPPVYVYDPRENVLRSDQHSNARGTDMAEHLPPEIALRRGGSVAAPRISARRSAFPACASINPRTAS